MTQRRALIELILAGALWGFTFIGQRFALESWGPLSMLTLRFLLAFVISLPIIYLVPSIRRCSFKRELKAAFVPGLLLGIVLGLQNYGLKLTSVANSGFITTLYIVFVPLFGAWFFKQRVPRGHAKVIALALAGAGLMCSIYRAHLNLGDLLIFLCAIIGGIQIAWIGWAVSKIESPFLFNTFQSFWIGVVSFAFASIFETVSFRGATGHAWFGLGYQIIGASLIAFLIQIRAQAVLSSSTASILFLLEAPFAALFAYIVFRESLSATQLAGAAVILAACLWAVYLDRNRPVPTSQPIL